MDILNVDYLGKSRVLTASKISFIRQHFYSSNFQISPTKRNRIIIRKINERRIRIVILTRFQVNKRQRFLSSREKLHFNIIIIIFKLIIITL